MSEMKQWVREHMKPIRACMSAIDKANQYDSPQSAWDNWDNGPELIWTIVQTKYDRSTLIRCVCEIAEHTFEIYEKENPGDNRPRKAIEAARIVAEDDTPKNRAAAYAAAYAVDAAAYTAAYAAYAAAEAAAYAAYTAADDVAYAAYVARAAADAAAYAAADAVDATAYDAADAERAWQADCVRRHFPVSPFLMEASN